MLIDQLTEVFCLIDDVCNCFEHCLSSRALPNHSRPWLTRTPSLSLSEIATIVVFFHLSNYRTFKHFYKTEVLTRLHREFPCLVSYNRFVELKSRCAAPLAALSRVLSGQVTSTTFVDSTPLPVCHNRRIFRHKTFAGLAQRGVSSMGWFFGMKLHLAINERGEILRFQVTPGNVHDSAPLFSGLLEGIVGSVFGDRGYILGAEKLRKLSSLGIRLVAKLRRKMKPRDYTLDEEKTLRKRNLIETVIGLLKNTCQIDHSRHRSPANAATNLLAGIVAYSFLPEKPTLSPIKKTQLLSE